MSFLLNSRWSFLASSTSPHMLLRSLLSYTVRFPHPLFCRCCCSLSPSITATFANTQLLLSQVCDCSVDLVFLAETALFLSLPSHPSSTLLQAKASMDEAVGAQVANDWATPVLPERGLVFSEVKYMQLQLCKPKLLPIKSYSLEKLENMEKKLAQEAKEKRNAERAVRRSSVKWTSPDLRQEAAAVPGVAKPTSSPSAPSPPLPTGPANASSATAADTPASSAAVAAPPIANPTSTSPLPLVKGEAKPASANGLPLAEEEEANADARMSPQDDRSSSRASASEVSASSSSSAEC